MVRLLRYSFPSLDFTSVTGNYMLSGDLVTTVRAFKASATMGSLVTLRTCTHERGVVPSFPSWTYTLGWEARNESTYFTYARHSLHLPSQHQTPSLRVTENALQMVQRHGDTFPGILSARASASGLKISLSLVLIQSEPLKYFRFVSLLPWY